MSTTEFKVISSSVPLEFESKVAAALDNGFNIQTTHVVVTAGGAILHVAHLVCYSR